MKVLVIRFNAVGDVVLTSVLCSTLKKSFPDAQVDYLMGESIAPLFDKTPIIDNILFFTDVERKNPLKFLKRVREIANKKYDIIVDASSTGRSELICLFSRGAKFRIGRLKPKQRRGFFYTHKTTPESLTTDKVTERLSMLEPLVKADFDIKYVNEMSIHITGDELCNRKNRMIEAGVDFDRPIFAFNVSSKKSYKIWSLEYMSDVVRYCVEHYQAQVVLCAGLKNEKKDAAKIHQQLNNCSDVFSSIEINSLRELAATLKNCQIYIGNEGGARHIAHAIGLPTVSIFSPSSDRDEWLPEAGPRHQGIQWQDIDSNLNRNNVSNFENGDAQYYELYNSIKPEDFIRLINDVISNTNFLSNLSGSD